MDFDITISIEEWAEYMRLLAKEKRANLSGAVKEITEAVNREEANDYPFDFKAAARGVVDDVNESGAGNFLTDFSDLRAEELGAVQDERDRGDPTPADTLDSVEAIAGWLEDHIRGLTFSYGKAAEAFRDISKQMDRLHTDTEKAISVAGFVMDAIKNHRKCKARKESSE